jgi:hypothetical protein
MEYSMYKTFANKYKTTVSKILSHYRINGHFGVRYKTKNGHKVRFFYNQGLKRVKTLPSKGDPKIDIEPNSLEIRGTRTSLIDRLLAEKCEWCGKKDVPLEMHYIRKLKDLHGKKQWEKF